MHIKYMINITNDFNSYPTLYISINIIFYFFYLRQKKKNYIVKTVSRQFLQ